MVETSKRGDQQEGELGLDGEVGDFRYVVQCVKDIYPILGISWRGNEKKLLDLLTVLEEERHEVLVSPPKPKGRRELKNLGVFDKF